MDRCRRCGKGLKDVDSHVRRVHPEAEYMRPFESRPHRQAIQMTIEDDVNSQGASVSEVTDGEWIVRRYGMRRHGWFIPVEVQDNQ